MKLANRISPSRTNGDAAPDTDPRENASAEVIDLASRTAYPAVAGRKGRSDAVGLAAGIGFVALLGAATLWGLNASRVPDAPQGTAPVVQNGPPNAFIPTDPLTPVPVLNGVPAGAPVPSPVFASPPQTAAMPMGNPYASPTVVFDAGAMPAAAAGALAGAPAGEATAGTGTTAADFASRVGGVGGGPAVARTDVDPRTTVTQGTMIPAVLETAINTDVPGFARAVVSQDVRSFDGTRILVPRSSRLIGQYQSGLQAGQRRAYVIWTRLIRPDGVSVALASPASAFDGSGGLPGRVDNHFFQRFGSSILLSVIGGLTAVASGGTSVVLGGGQDAASTALQQSGQIAPTVRVRQGEPIRVFTARDLDFSQAPRL
ncbi:type VI secretion protein [Croceibacterium mercuriale]|uniref:Type VI secretion protein n=1 Tax=Croceibacterium mercuriale TaxID=1572751 RepID=A0A0B2C1C1_9SPHN|nr:TrbI/VirB10 family protein [Croceibacterium mercuriale]KHL26082.1 type VI secretion protein [Croceibacterium mercuriale]